MFFITINLLPYRAAKIKRRQLLFNLKLALAVLCGILSYLVLYAGNWLSFSQHQRQLTQLTQELAVYQDVTTQLNSVREQLETLKNQENSLALRYKNRTIPLLLLSKLAGLDFERIYLTQLSYEKGNLLLTGAGIDATAVNKFLQQLGASNFFSAPQDVKIYDELVRLDASQQLVVKNFQLKTVLQW